MAELKSLVIFYTKKLIARGYVSRAYFYDIILILKGRI